MLHESHNFHKECAFLLMVKMHTPFSAFSYESSEDLCSNNWRCVFRALQLGRTFLLMEKVMNFDNKNNDNLKVICIVLAIFFIILAFAFVGNISNAKSDKNDDNETKENVRIFENYEYRESSEGIKLIFSKNLEEIDSWKFASTDGYAKKDFTEVISPSDGNLTRINTMAFYWQTSLKTVVLSDKIEFLGDGIFERCYNLENLIIYNKIPPKMDGDIFNWAPTLNGDEYFHTKPNKNFTVFVPNDAVENYKNSQWKKYNIQPLSNIQETVDSYQLLFSQNDTPNSVESQIHTNEPTNNTIGVVHIITTIVAILAIISVIVIAIIYWRRRKIVFENSQRIKELLELNKTIQFRHIQSHYYNQQACNSKRQLDNLSMNDYLISLIDSNERFYRNIIESISFNQNKYNDYIIKSKRIISTATENFCKSLNFTLIKFQKYEERIFKRKLLRKPQFDVTIHCKVTYTSPQGRNHYEKKQDYRYYELKRFYEYTTELKVQRQTRQYQIKVERAKMTDSLRYDILKRDNFRCQICGSSAQDGVKLHVDHIIPVSKGGQTIESNLRTLCDRCNMGKSDKM